MTQEVEGEIQTGRLRTDHCLLYVYSQSYEPSLRCKERYLFMNLDLHPMTFSVFMLGWRFIPLTFEIYPAKKMTIRIQSVLTLSREGGLTPPAMSEEPGHLMANGRHGRN